eukprot:scaffold694_cov338-Pavlova_lutheri.AAC.33
MDRSPRLDPNASGFEPDRSIRSTQGSMGHDVTLVGRRNSSFEEEDVRVRLRATPCDRSESSWNSDCQDGEGTEGTKEPRKGGGKEKRRRKKELPTDGTKRRARGAEADEAPTGTHDAHESTGWLAKTCTSHVDGWVPLHGMPGASNHQVERRRCESHVARPHLRRALWTVWSRGLDCDGETRGRTRATKTHTKRLTHEKRGERTKDIRADGRVLGSNRSNWSESNAGCPNTDGRLRKPKVEEIHPLVAKAVLLDFPGLVFFTTYTLLVLFWAEIYHQARSLPTGRLRPAFVLINAVVYAIQSALWVYMGLSPGPGYDVADLISHIFLAVVSVVAASGFAIYGGRLFVMLKRFPIESRGRRKKLREVGLVTAICTTAFAIRAVLVAYCAIQSKKASLDLLSHPVLDAIYYILVEILPSTLVLFILRKLPPRRAASGYQAIN